MLGRWGRSAVLIAYVFLMPPRGAWFATVRFTLESGRHEAIASSNPESGHCIDKSECPFVNGQAESGSERIMIFWNCTLPV